AIASGDPGLADAARDAFAHAVSVGSFTAGGATLAAALFAAVVLRRVPRRLAGDAEVPEPVKT
ncbi:MAG: MFS transporter, partial [Spirillospora sp.]